VNLQNSLNKAYSCGKHITIFWIPGHFGIKDNEIADGQVSLAINDINISQLEQIIYDDSQEYTYQKYIRCAMA